MSRPVAVLVVGAAGGVTVLGTVIGEAATTKLDVVIKVGIVGAKHATATLATARVALSRAGDNVAEFDAAGLAVPDAKPNDKYEDSAKDDR